ncbi:MAG: hypothetical protein ACPGPF_07450 [Pontibacterium sp.]
MFIRATVKEGYVNFWAVDAEDGQSTTIIGHRHNDAGTPIGDEFIVNTKPVYEKARPSITDLGDDGFVVTWPNIRPCKNQTAPQEVVVSSVSGQCFDLSGNKVGNEFSAQANPSFTDQTRTLLADYLKHSHPRDPHVTCNKITSELLSVVVNWDAQ